LGNIKDAHAKFHADPLKTVAMHKEQRNTQTHGFGDTETLVSKNRYWFGLL